MLCKVAQYDTYNQGFSIRQQLNILVRNNCKPQKQQCGISVTVFFREWAIKKKLLREDAQQGAQQEVRLEHRPHRLQQKEREKLLLLEKVHPNLYVVVIVYI